MCNEKKSKERDLPKKAAMVQQLNSIALSHNATNLTPYVHKSTTTILSKPSIFFNSRTLLFKYDFLVQAVFLSFFQSGVTTRQEGAGGYLNAMEMRAVRAVSKQ